MSKEIDDIEVALATNSQPLTQTDANDPPSGELPAVGLEPARSVLPSPDAAEPPANQPDAPTASPCGPSPASGAAYCAQCETDVIPRVPNHCPVCGGWVVDNDGALVTGLRSKKLAKIVDAYRVDLIEKLVAERGGAGALDVCSRIAIENFALLAAQHKTIESRLDQDGLFTKTGRRRSAFDMLKSISETLDRLRAALPPSRTVEPRTTSLDAMTTSALLLLRSLNVRLLAGEELSEFDKGRLSLLRSAAHGEVLLPADPPVDVPPAASYDPPTETMTLDVAPVEEITTPTTTPPPAVCPFCMRECLGEGHPLFSVLHRLDPIEVKKRDEYATAEMLHMIGRKR